MHKGTLQKTIIISFLIISILGCYVTLSFAGSKFGDDAKPFVDRIREIADIVWRTQARAEELPSSTPTPLITSADDNP
ncbi:MAG: hypothetical protein HY807_10680 [Nitrospirae bacterium]|nr:hypothetical protein [Nitrospirota bacterium]